MSETVLCSNCKIPVKNGSIEVFLQQKLTWKYDEDPSIEKPYQSSKVCKKCLIGWNIPVQRCMNKNKDQQKEQVWEFGIVESYKEESNLHSVRFIDDSSEWVKVEMNTFEQYIAYCTNMITLLNQKKDIATATAAAAAAATAKAADSGNQENSTKDSEIYTPFDMEYDHGLHSPAGLLASPAGTPLKSELQVLPALRGGNTVAHNQSSPRLLEIPYLSYHHASPYSPAKKRQRIAQHPSDVGYGRDDDHMVGTKIAASHMSPPLQQNSRYNKMMYSTWTSTSTPTRDKGGNQSTKTTNDTPKQRQRQLQSTWSPAEDNMLLQSVAATKNTHQFGWPQVAKTIPGRTGKQCRERYLNHLKPSLKLAKYWSPMEDAAIFSLFAKHGSKWSMMSKFITGRSDNNIKNRYNHLKRKFEKQIESILLRYNNNNNNNNTQSSLHVLPPLSVQLQSLVNELKQQQNHLLPSLSQHGEFGNALLKYAAFEIIQKSSPSYNRSIRDNNRTKLQALASPLSPSSSSLRPTWRLAMFPGEICARCGLTVPSVQCGRLICNTLGWCENCYDILPCVSGDLLRKIHSSYAASASQA